jgi:hypothetical protein
MKRNWLDLTFDVLLGLTGLGFVVLVAVSFV